MKTKGLKITEFFNFSKWKALFLGTFLFTLFLPLVSSAQLSEIPQDFSFNDALYLGLQSEGVTYLQILLKELGPDIYPEALVTGYYGSLTAKAVTNFQLEYEVVSSSSHPAAGYVGPLTRVSLNDVLSDLRKTEEEQPLQPEQPQESPTQTVQVDQTVKGDLTVEENIKASRLYQENSDLIINTLGSGNLMFNSADGLHLYGSQVIIDSTSLQNPLVYIDSPLKIKGSFAQADGSVTFGGNVSAGTLNTSNLTVSGTASLSSLSGKLTITDTSSPQLTLKYDSSDYLDISIASDGTVTFNTTGTSPKFVFSDDVEISGDLTAKTGRTATYVVAASDAPSHVKAQADYVCDGTADEVEIQAAIDTGEKLVQLSEGTFSLSSTLMLPDIDGFSLVGSGKRNTILFLEDGFTGVGIRKATQGTTNYYQRIGFLTIDGNKDNNPNGTRGIETSGLEKLQLHDVYIVDTKTDGIYGASSKIVNLNNIEVCSAGGNGIYIYNTWGWTGSEILIRDSSSQGLRIEFGGEHILTNLSLDMNWKHQLILSSTIRNQLTNVWSSPRGPGDSNNAGISIISNSTQNTIINLNIRPVSDWESPYLVEFWAADGSTLSKNTIIGGSFYGGGFPSKTAVRLSKSGTGVIADNYITGVQFDTALTPVSDATGQTGTIRLANNIGYTTENSGTGLIADGSTSIKVAHGLATVPTRVQITLTSSLGNASEIYVSDKDIDVDGTKFQVDVDIDPGSDVTFDWRAAIGEGN
jgi:hypothetical protein